MIPSYWKSLVHKSALWAGTASYLAAVGMIMLVAQNAVSAEVAIIVLGLTSVLIILVVVQHEINTVHHLVCSYNGQLDDRIAQLIASLHTAGIPIPDDPAEKKVSI